MFTSPNEAGDVLQLAIALANCISSYIAILPHVAKVYLLHDSEIQRCDTTGFLSVFKITCSIKLINQQLYLLRQ